MKKLERDIKNNPNLVASQFMVVHYGMNQEELQEVLTNNKERFMAFSGKERQLLANNLKQESYAVTENDLYYMKDQEIIQHLHLDPYFLQTSAKRKQLNYELIKLHLKHKRDYSFSLLPLDVSRCENREEGHLITGESRVEAYEVYKTLSSQLKTSQGKIIVGNNINTGKKEENRGKKEENIEENVRGGKIGSGKGEGKEKHTGEEKRNVEWVEDTKEPVFISFFLEDGKYLSFFDDELLDSIHTETNQEGREEIVFYNPSVCEPRFFTYKQFCDLQAQLILLVEHERYEYIPILNQLNEYQNIFSEQNKYITRYKRDYELLTPADRVLSLRYFSFLFILSQYLRWWKGPNTPWVYKWKETRSEKEDAFRSQMIVEILNELNSTMDKFSVEGKIFIQNLKWIEYNLTKGGFKIGNELLTELYILIRGGNFCIADASDRFVKSSVAYMFYLLLNFELDIKPTNAMYEKFSGNINFVIQCRNQCGGKNIVQKPQPHVFSPIEEKNFEMTNHVDPEVRKKYE